MFDFFKSQKWALVKTFKIKHTSCSYVYHIHLFESSKGKRKAEYTCDGHAYDINKTGKWLKSTDLYQLQVYRWLQGRRDPEIPAYDQIGEEDTANFLKGKI
jgi:hypothetical protein